MKINAKVNLVNTGYVVGVASILIENCFLVHDIRIVQRRNGGYLVAMPSRKRNNGLYQDIAHPINKETRELIEEKVMNYFYTEIKEGLSSLEIPKEYKLSYNVDNIHDIALVRIEDNKIIDTYELEDYKFETLVDFRDEVLEKIESLK